MVVICGFVLCVLLFKVIGRLTDTEAPSSANPPTPLGVYICVAAVLVLCLLLRWFDDSTELVPNHDGVLGACYIVAGLAGLLCAGLMIRESKGSIAGRVRLALVGGLLATIAVGMVSVYGSEIVEGLIDFPPGRTTSYHTLLLVSRAYRTHDRFGQSWYIQTTPLWSNLHIAKQDYHFMLAHRRPGDGGLNPDEISSQSYFCAHATIERFGDALRVMHAGTHTLPEGTVITCPSSSR